MFKFHAPSSGSSGLHPALRWARRLAFFAIGLLLAASALVVSVLLLTYATARALCRALIGRPRVTLGGDRPAPGAFRRGVRHPSRGEVVDVEARSLS